MWRALALLWSGSAAVVGLVYAVLAREPGPVARAAVASSRRGPQRGPQSDPQSAAAALEWGGSGALLVGDVASGTLWESADAERLLDVPLHIASQTKLVTALVVRGVMRSAPTRLHLDTRAWELVPSWPATGHAGAVRLRHLLTFTTGIAPRDSRASCVESGRDFVDCLARVGRYDFSHAPGTTFVYASWHLYVAAAMALRAAQQPLTKAAWVALVRAHVYAPAGVGAAPDFPDTDCLFLHLGCWLTQRDVPHFSGGLRISGRDVARVLRATNASFWREAVDLARQAATPFAFGHWIEASPSGGTVHVTSGMHGAYAWYDAGDAHYAVLAYSWWRALRRIVLLSVVFAGGCTAGLLLRSALEPKVGSVALGL